MNNIGLLHKLKVRPCLFSQRSESGSGTGTGIGTACMSDDLSLLATSIKHNNDKLANSSHLIVDNNKTNRLIIKLILERNGVSVTEAKDALHTINLIKENNVYDIIWLDLQIPRIDGLMCAKVLRDELQYKGPIIGITGHVDCDTVTDCIEAGMQDVIGKPITEKALIAHVEKVCNMLSGNQ